VCFCTGHFVMVPINLTCPHCLQHFFFEHLLHLYFFTKCVWQTVFQRRSKLRCRSFYFGCKKRSHWLFFVIDSITSVKRTMLLSDWLWNRVGLPLKFNTLLFTSPLCWHKWTLACVQKQFPYFLLLFNQLKNRNTVHIIRIKKNLLFWFRVWLTEYVE